MFLGVVTLRWGLPYLDANAIQTEDLYAMGGSNVVHLPGNPTNDYGILRVIRRGNLSVQIYMVVNQNNVTAANAQVAVRFIINGGADPDQFTDWINLKS